MRRSARFVLFIALIAAMPGQANPRWRRRTVMSQRGQLI